MSRVDGWRRTTGRGASGEASGKPGGARAAWSAIRACASVVSMPLILGASSAVGCTGADPVGEPGGPVVDAHHAEAAQAASTGTTCVVLRRQPGVKVADGFVSSEKKDNNYGASGFASVSGAAGNTARALFRFDLGSIPANATILSAGLSVTQNNTGAAVARIHLVNGPWDEATVSWNKLGASFGPVFSAVSNNSPIMVFPVGPQVQAWVKGSVANNGFLVDSLDAPLTRFYTQEWVLQPQRPYLSVCYNVVCAPGFADCNGNAADGCETDLATLGNCGACGAVCALPHASTSCVDGACQLAACDPGSFDCDGDAANGCEPTPCDDGAHCGDGGDCESQVCVGGVCAAPACDDGVQNGGETDVDCGNECAACGDGQACDVGTDCASLVCSGGLCQAPTCSDGVKNQGELAVDAGGPCVSTWRSALYPENWTPAFTTANGLFLHDFSYAGYHRSEVPLPSSFPGVVVDVMTKNAQPNSAADSRKAFVDAITAVIAAGGGVVYVPDGEYVISSPITIQSSNVLIRGQSRANTKLFFSKIPNSQAGFIFKGAEPSAAGSVALVADGQPRSKEVFVNNAASFAVGNEVLIDMAITQAWIDEHGMNGIWTHASNNALNLRRDFFRRTITAVDTSSSPNKITLDVPLRYPMKTRDGAAIRLDTGFLREVGVEHLSVNNVTTVALANANPRAHVLWFQRVQDGFVRDVGTYASTRGAVQTSHLQSGGVYIVTSKRMTVIDSAMEHAQNHGDGGAGYAFEASMSNEILFKDNVATDVRHAFTQNWDFGASGLVFLRCIADDNIAVNPTFSTPGTSEFHHRLAIANLYDQSHDSSGYMALNRTSESSYSGHTATQSVFWNVSGGGPESIVRSYQFGMGYIIGTTNITPRVVADFIDAFFLADQGTAPIDYLEGADLGSTLSPQSLFEDQLARRVP